jgi:hypothetical protein
MSSRPRPILFLLGACALVAACGGADRPPSAPPPAELGPAPQTVEDAQEQIARARAELGAPAPDTGASADSAAKREPSSTTPGTTPAPSPPPPPPARPAGKVEEPPSRNADVCQSPCRAIASMRRAVSALCRMTGTDDARCTDAKKTLAESETKLAPCGC